MAVLYELELSAKCFTQLLVKCNLKDNKLFFVNKI